MACVKQAKKTTSTFGLCFQPCPESAANQHGRAAAFFPVVVNCHRLRPISGAERGGQFSRRSLEGELKSWPLRKAGQSLSSPGSDERNGMNRSLSWRAQVVGAGAGK
jgi:hypothetical protein